MSRGSSTTQIVSGSRRSSPQTAQSSPTLGDVEADLAERGPFLHGDDRVGQPARVLAGHLQDVERDALRRLGPDAGQAAELVDEGAERAGVHRRAGSPFVSWGWRRTVIRRGATAVDRILGAGPRASGALRRRRRRRRCGQPSTSLAPGNASRSRACASDAWSASVWGPSAAKSAGSTASTSGSSAAGLRWWRRVAGRPARRRGVVHVEHELHRGAEVCRQLLLDGGHHLDAAVAVRGVGQREVRPLVVHRDEAAGAEERLGARRQTLEDAVTPRLGERVAVDGGGRGGGRAARGVSAARCGSGVVVAAGPSGAGAPGVSGSPGRLLAPPHRTERGASADVALGLFGRRRLARLWRSGGGGGRGRRCCRGRAGETRASPRASAPGR